MTNWKAAYPDRYYVSYDTTATQPAPIIGRFDMALYGNLDGFPEASELVALTPEQWETLPAVGCGVLNGQIVPYTPPVVAVPLKTQAASAQAWIQQQANLATAMGEVFTPGMKAYVKAIAAIASGTDTTSTALPAQPTDVMAAATA